MKAVFDTNILIDYLKGVTFAREEIDKYKHPLISIITWMEVLVGIAPETEEEYVVKSFLSGFTAIPIDTTVSESAILIRRKYKVRLPDAIIWATAETQDALLLTRNSKDFHENNPIVRIPYVL